MLDRHVVAVTFGKVLDGAHDVEAMLLVDSVYSNDW